MREISNESHAVNLCDNGRRELLNIGKRFRKRFINIFETDKYRMDFHFESTCKSRSAESMKMFMHGFLEKEGQQNTPGSHIKYDMKILECQNDSTYRFFDICQKYTFIHNCLKETDSETEKFFQLSEIQAITERINKKIGLSPENHLKPLELKSLYISCAYQILVLNNSLHDVPCKFFDDEARNAFEYLNDIKHFFKKSNYHDINLKISTPLIKKVYESTMKAFQNCESENYKSNTPVISGDFGFAHAETIFPLLGVFKIVDDMKNRESFINHENYNRIKNNRSFKPSFYTPMAANLMLMVSCSPTTSQVIF
ncbi:Multiple inositol polyphosphate phosphatase 1 [Thelohanellus kitauei]|nr:Multiple inositol polyphosphate phosphatase 1 [Thelohanellus kitauei]